MSSMAHVPVFYLETRSMTRLMPKPESKLAWSLRKSTDPRYIINPPFVIDYWKRSIIGVEEEGGKVKEGKRFTIGVVIPGVVLVDIWASIINICNYDASIAASRSYIALFKANAEEGRDAGVWTDAGSGVRGGVRILDVKVEAGADSVEITFCGSLNEKSSDDVVKGKSWLITLAMIEERNERNIMSTTRFVRSEIRVVFPEESRNPIPWRLSTWKKALRTESTMRSASYSAETVGIAKYAATVAVKSLIETEEEKER